MIQKPIDFRSNKFLSIGFLLMLTILLANLVICNRSIFFDRMINLSNSSIISHNLAANEHRPQWVPKEIFNGEDLKRLSEKFAKVQVNSGKASWLIKEWQPRRIVLQLNATTNTELTFHQFYYPGWTAQFQGSLQSLPVTFSELGLLQISVPTGKQEVYLTLEAGIEERIGQLITAFSVIVILFLGFFHIYWNPRKPNKSLNQGD